MKVLTIRAEGRWHIIVQMIMNKFLTLFLGLFVVCCYAYAKKEKPISKSKLSISILTKNISEKGKLITFKCSDADEYSTTFISDFVCENGTDERIFIEWENARLTGSRIVFGTDRRITMDQPKADEAVSPHGHSISRDITGQIYVQDGYMQELFRTKDLKKNKDSYRTVFFMIPIRFADGHVEEFNLEYRVWYVWVTPQF